jgi:diadenosine tetraphosphate (Ap4A) HIT family hydrolase
MPAGDGLLLSHITVSVKIGHIDVAAPETELRMTQDDRAENCLLCTMEDAGPESVIFRDDLWAAEVVPGYEVPGWFILRARRHAERITGLDDDELASLAFRARDLVAAVSEVANAPATYLLIFGENYPHFHALIAARNADVPADRRGGDIMKLRLEQADPAAAIALVPAVRAAHQKRAAAKNSAG